MFTALNDRVIATVQQQDNVTESGIILSDAPHACERYKVCYTTDVTKSLQDKTIYAEARFKNHQLPDKGTNGETYVIIPLADILAVQA